MTVTRVVTPRAAIARPEPSRADRRISVRLWTLLHAQVLLRGPDAGIHDAAFVEDDRRRLR